jgi:hypothetical protein
MDPDHAFAIGNEVKKFFQKIHYIVTLANGLP